MAIAFFHVLRVPTIISAIQKIQHESDKSLRVLHAYYLRSKIAKGCASLESHESEALDSIMRTAAEESAGTAILFGFSHQVFLHGGTIAGQLAQLLVGANTLTARNKQIVNVGRSVAAIDPGLGEALSSVMGIRQRELIAYWLGAVAQVTGYCDQRSSRPSPPLAGRADRPRPASRDSMPLMRFRPLPGSELRGVS